jgi:hypothetical protein
MHKQSTHSSGRSVGKAWGTCAKLINTIVLQHMRPDDGLLFPEYHKAHRLELRGGKYHPCMHNETGPINVGSRGARVRIRKTYREVGWGLAGGLAKQDLVDASIPQIVSASRGAGDTTL